MKSIHINEKPHKAEDNIVYWFNGKKWLIRETCKSEKEAKKLLEQINANRPTN